MEYSQKNGSEMLVRGSFRGYEPEKLKTWSSK